MTKRNKRILRLTLYIILLALVTVPAANAIRGRAATWNVNACYVTNSASGIALKASKSATSVTRATIPNNTYIYVRDISGTWGYTRYNGVYGYVDLSGCIRRSDVPEVADEVVKRLQAVQSFYGNGDTWTGSINASASGQYRTSNLGWGPSECFGFAAEVWRALFGTEHEMAISYYAARKYVFASDADMTVVGQYTPAQSTLSNVTALLLKAKPGDIIQACSRSATDGQHTMVVESITANGIYVYDANLGGGNKIRKNVYYTWSEIYNERCKGGVSLYTFTGYPPQNIDPVTGSAITVKNTSGSNASSFYLGDTVNFSAVVNNASSITFYVVDASTGKLVSEYTSKLATYSYTIVNDTSFASGSKQYYVYYKASNAVNTIESAKVYFTVNSPTVSISGSEVTIPSGTTHRLTANSVPGGGTLTWTSNNSNVATVDSSGVVTGKSAGTAVITAIYTYKGTGGINIRREAQIKITVINPKFNVTFDACGGNASFTSKQVTKTERYGDLPTATRTGYTFAGWFTAQSGGTNITAQSIVEITADTTLYAHWIPNTYTLTFNAAGGTVSPASMTITYDAAYGNLPVPSKPGYKFLGWFTAESGGTQITSSTKVTVTANQTLYAHWELATYTIQFDACGGTPSFASKSVTYTGVYGELPTATRTGYTFVGWFTEASGGTQITPETQVTITANQTLYAHWTANKYDVTFDANGGSVSETQKTVTFGSGYGTLPIPHRAGYSFIGWFTAPENGTRIISDTVVSTAYNHTLYAVWEPGTYTVTFNCNGGTSDVVSKSVTYLATYGTLPEPSRTGYTFVGWFTEINGGVMITEETVVEIIDDQMLYAHWAVNTYTVSFETNSVESSFDSKRVTFDTAYGELPVSKKTGYTFAGWYTEATGGTLITEQSILKIGEDSTLYAHWNPNKYTVYLDENGGDSHGLQVDVYFELPYGTLPVPVKRGYVFVGWYTDANGGTKITADSIVDNPHNITLYAHWTPKKINLTFDADGGVSTYDSKEVTFDDIYGELPTAERIGYRFIGWRTADFIDITEDSIVDVDSDCTLVAVWQPLTYTLTFDSLGGTFDDGKESYQISVTYDDVYPMLLMPYRYGYRFAGWVVDTEERSYINSGDTVKITRSQTVYADWVPLMHTVTFDANGGSVDIDTMQVIFSELYGDLPVPERVGYTFVGWVMEDGVMIESTSTVDIAANTTLTAVWNANKYRVKLKANGGTADVYEIEVEYDSEYGYLPIPVKKGYKFTRWVDADGNAMLERDIVKITSNIVLTAEYVPMVYDITFDTNGAKIVISPITVTFDERYGELPVLERAGYIFEGWYLNGVELITSASIVDITEDSVLTARWTAIEYNVLLDPDGGFCNMENISITYDTVDDVLPEPVKAGYSFAGWFDEYGNQITGDMTVQIEDGQVLIAHWTPLIYNVYFSIYGEIYEDLTIQVTYATEYGELPIPVSKGYVFKYWVDENGTVINPTDIFSSIADRTLFAVVDANSFNVTFDAKNGEAEYYNKSVKYHENVGTLPDAIRMGYLFLGWYTEGGILVTEETLMTFSEDIVFHAKWAKIESNTEQVFNGNELLVTGCEIVAGVNLLFLIVTALRRKKKKA